MKRGLLRRLENLEARIAPKASPVICYGWVKPLPADYVGERHTVIVKRKPCGSPNLEPTGSPQFEWCEFEERPGPAPLNPEDDVFPEEDTAL